jgi:hypothetical protein
MSCVISGFVITLLLLRAAQNRYCRMRMENWTETGLHAAVPVLVRKTIDGCDNVNTPWQRRTNPKKRNERNKSGWVFWARSTNVHRRRSISKFLFRNCGSCKSFGCPPKEFSSHRGRLTFSKIRSATRKYVNSERCDRNVAANANNKHTIVSR